MTTVEPPQWLVDETIAVLLAAVDRDVERMTEGLQRISDDGWQSMYGACCGWAEAITRMTGWREELGEDSDEGMLVVERLPGTPQNDADPALWASRFVACVANKDAGTSMALFDASIEIGDQHHMDCIIQLLAIAGSVGRQKLDDKDGDS